MARQAGSATSDGQADDRMLVQRAQSEPGAVGELYDRYFDDIYRFVNRRVGPREDVEDLVADVFRRMVEKLDGFEPRGSGFRGWLYTIAANRVRDYHRIHGREGAFVDMEEYLTGSERQPIFADQPSEDPEGAALRREQVQWVLEQMDRLTPAQQRVLRLRYGEGLRNEEIAQVTDRSPSAVSSLIHRALRRLRDFAAATPHTGGDRRE